MASVHEAQPSGVAHELYEPAWQMRWRVPELALMLGDQAVAQARRLGDRSLRLRAEAVALFASNRLGHGVEVTGRAIAAVRDAEAADDHELATELRIELACCARSAGGHEVALRILQPVVERERIEPTLRAHALIELAAALPGKQQDGERADALDEAERLYSATSELNRDTSRVLLSRVHTARAGNLRRNGDFEEAARVAEAGLSDLERLGDPAAESGELHARLVLERVHSLLDLGCRGAAVEAAAPVVRAPVRAAAAGPSGWLRLALATRVHLPSGELAAAVQLLNDAAANAERHKLDCLLSESLSMSAQVHERSEEFAEALTCLRRAYAADRRWRAAMHSARVRLLTEFPALAEAGAAQGRGARTAHRSAEAPAPRRAADAREQSDGLAAAAPRSRTHAAEDPARTAADSAHAEHFAAVFPGAVVPDETASSGGAGASAPERTGRPETAAHPHEPAEPEETAGRRRADGTGRSRAHRAAEPPAETESPSSRRRDAAEYGSQHSTPAPESFVSRWDEPAFGRESAASAESATTFAAGHEFPQPEPPQPEAPAEPEDPLDAYRQPGEGSVRDAARRLMETLTSRVDEDRKPAQDPLRRNAADEPSTGRGADMPAPQAPQQPATGGGRRRAPEPDDEAPAGHGGVDVPVGNVTSAPFSEDFPVRDFGSRADDPLRAQSDSAPDSAPLSGFPAPRRYREETGDPAAQQPPWETARAADRWDEQPPAPDVTAIMPVIAVPEDDAEPHGDAVQVGAVEPAGGTERPAAPQAEDSAPPYSDSAAGRLGALDEFAEPSDGGRRSHGRSLAEIRESLAMTQDRENESRGGARHAPAADDYLRTDAEQLDDPPRSGGSWADRYLSAYAGEDHRATGRRAARHADPDEAAAPAASDPGASPWDSAPWERGTGDAGDGSQAPADNLLPGPGVRGLGESTGANAAEPASRHADPSSEHARSAAELLARHRGAEQQAQDSPQGEVGLADLLAEALLAYENGRRGDEHDDGQRASRHSDADARPSQESTSDSAAPGARHRRPADSPSPHDSWTSRGY